MNFFYFGLFVFLPVDIRCVCWGWWCLLSSRDSRCWVLCVTTTLCYHQAVLPPGLVTTRLCYHQTLLPSGVVTTTLCYTQASLPPGFVSIRLCYHKALLHPNLVTLDRCQAQPSTRPTFVTSNVRPSVACHVRCAAPNATTARAKTSIEPREPEKRRREPRT